MLNLLPLYRRILRHRPTQASATGCGRNPEGQPHFAPVIRHQQQQGEGRCLGLDIRPSPSDAVGHRGLYEVREMVYVDLISERACCFRRPLDRV